VVVDQKLHEATRKAVYDWSMLAPAVNTLLGTDSIWATVWVYSIAIAYQRAGNASSANITQGRSMHLLD